MTRSGLHSTPLHLGANANSSPLPGRNDSSHIATVTSKLRDLNEKVEAIKREQRYQREIEAEFRNSSEKTNSKAVWWILMQMGVLLATGWWQMRYLKVGPERQAVG